MQFQTLNKKMQIELLKVHFEMLPIDWDNCFFHDEKYYTMYFNCYLRKNTLFALIKIADCLQFDFCPISDRMIDIKIKK